MRTNSLLLPLLLTALLLTIPVLHAIPLHAPDPMEGYATSIAQQMYRAMGGSGDCPRVILTEDQQVATLYLDPHQKSEHRIRIRRSAVEELYAALGDSADDALAVIIGHELWHYMAGHGSGVGFGSTDPKYSSNELDADQNGVLMAYFCGYSAAFEVYDLIFSKVSTPAGLEPNRFLSRKSGDEGVKKRINTALEPFRLGMALLLHGATDGAPDAAIQCFEETQRRIRQNESNLLIRQVEYAIGLCHLQNALNATDIHCRLPLSIESDGFLEIRGNGNNYPNIVLPALARAESCFKKCRLADPEWYPAMLGQLTVEAIRGYESGFNYLSAKNLSASYLIYPWKDALTDPQLRIKYKWYQKMVAERQQFLMDVRKLNQLMEDHFKNTETLSPNWSLPNTSYTTFDELKKRWSNNQAPAKWGLLDVREQDNVWYLKLRYNEWIIEDCTQLRPTISTGNGIRWNGPYSVATDPDPTHKRKLITLTEKGSTRWAFLLYYP